MQSPLVDFIAAFRVGSQDDPVGKEGLANLTAELMAGGGTTRQTYKQILEDGFEMATQAQAQIDKELTIFWGSSHVDHEERFGALFRDMLERPALAEEDFARVKDEQLSYLRVELRGNNDEELAKEVLYNELYAGHPYGHHCVGTVKGLEAIRLEDVRAFYQEHFAPGGQSRVRARGGRYEVPAGVHATLLDKPEARSVAISFGHHLALRRGDPDYPALLVAQAWLGQHRNGGRLFDQIREVRGLNYGDYAYLEYFPRGMYQFEPDPGLARRNQIFQVWIRPVVWEKSIFALRLACYEIEQLRQHGISEEDFARTRQFLRKYSKLLVKTGSLRQRYAVDAEFYGTPEYAEYIEQGLANLTREKVQEAAQRYLTTKNLWIVAVGPRMEEWGALLQSGEATPITYESEMPDEVMRQDEVVANWELPMKSVERMSYLEAFEE